MSFINFARKEISFKIVYYGAALCGKTTNVEKIHEGLSPQSRGNLTTLSTKQDRTLFFDFLPLRSEIIKGFTSKFQIYTVPGQVIYSETRKLVLRNVDGIVFVADSQWSKQEENAASFRDMEGNLKEQGDSIDRIPYIIQFNKRDMPDIAPIHYLNFMLNQRAVAAPYAEAVAVNGVGVLESLNLISKMVLSNFMQKNNMKTTELPNDLAVSQKGR